MHLNFSNDNMIIYNKEKLKIDNEGLLVTKGLITKN